MMRSVASIWGLSARSVLSTWVRTTRVRVSGEMVSLTNTTLPLKRRWPRAGTEISTFCPMTTEAASCSGMAPTTQTLERSARVKSGSPGWATWPWLILRSITTPERVAMMPA